MKRTIIESPFRNEDVIIRNENILYVNAVARVLSKKQAANPIFFHTFYTQFLDDDCDVERRLGLDLSFAHLNAVAEARVITIDRGISIGMKYGVKSGVDDGQTIDVLSLSPSLQHVVDVYYENVSNVGQAEALEKLYQSVSSLQAINNLGDLGDYREQYSGELLKTAELIGQFFAPLVSHCPALVKFS
ncbi:hypothetical protein AB4254_11755 [Vibrio breoganii]